MALEGPLKAGSVSAVSIHSKTARNHFLAAKGGQQNNKCEPTKDMH